MASGKVFSMYRFRCAVLAWWRILSFGDMDVTESRSPDLRPS